MLAAAELTGVLDAGPLGLGSAGAPQPATLPEGSKIGDFVINRLLGRGGMGEVYLATRDDPSFRQQVALKLLRVDMAVEEKLFARERRMLARRGVDLPARLIEVFRDANVTDSGGRWFRIACEADWPATGTALRFVSEPLPTDPAPRLGAGALTARVDPADRSNFAVILA